MSGVDGDPKNCWELWKCPKETREDCFAYKRNLGRMCWTISYSIDSALEKDFQKCLECLWYKNLNSQT